jgi:CelD/BcsL family acetyltransferase involved in cellulose biosynthesis
MSATPAVSATVYVINPLEDPRWREFVERHPQSSIFHTNGWLEVLQRTYRYKPLVLTTSPPAGQLENGWVFCSIDSILTGRRWVSLPFSDHCQPLSDDSSYEDVFVPTIESVLEQDRLRYLETRPLESPANGSSPLPPAVSRSTRAYCFHCVDLTVDLQTLFRNCHKDSIQRKIRRAEREGLAYETGCSPAQLDAFHGLQVLTRKRHGLPPQPKQWFRNIVTCLGQAAKIRVAYKGQQPVAAILTICHKDTVVYKYGCSDAAHNNLGGMSLLFWRTIEESKHEGLRKFDLGRSDLDNEGLITFKDRWGSVRSDLCYSRFTSSQAPKDVYRLSSRKTAERLVTNLFARMPSSLACGVGELFYRHLG